MYTLKSLTSCPRSGICFAANASSGRGEKTGRDGEGSGRTITDGDDVVDDFHGGATVGFFVENVHGIRGSGRCERGVGDRWLHARGLAGRVSGGSDGQTDGLLSRSFRERDKVGGKSCATSWIA